jgi:hypothetical protein
MGKWSRWRPFPDPLNEGLLVAPLGPGVYELRNASTGEPVLFGRSKYCAHRMSSLLRQGPGTRRNTAKRNYVQRHLTWLEYRTRACETVDDSVEVERELRRRGGYRFPT